MYQSVDHSGARQKSKWGIRKHTLFRCIVLDHFTWSTTGHVNTVCSFLSSSPFVSGNRWIWEAVLRHDRVPRGIQCSLVSPDQSWVVWPSEQQMDQTGLVQPRLDFCMGHFLFFPPTHFPPVKWQAWQCCHFFIFNELTGILNRRSVSTGRFSQQFSYIIRQKQTTTKKKDKSLAYMELPWNMKTKGTWCNAAFIIDFVPQSIRWWPTEIQ